MRRCVKCGEELEDSFEACWNCGTSREGVENPDFLLEVDVAEEPDTSEGGRRLNAFWAAALVTAVVGYLDFLIPYLVASPVPLSGRQKLGAMIGAAFWSLVIAGGGGLAGWVGARCERIIRAAWKGGFVVLAVQVLLIAISGASRFLAMSFANQCAVGVNVFALGAIAGSVGWIFGRRLRDPKPASERVQFSLSEMLFLITLFGLLFASLAVMMR